MSVFPQTSLTLLQKLTVDVTGGNNAAWVRFFGLYTPAIRRFVEWNDRVHDPDDIVQDVYLKLVDVIRSGKYNPGKARFRTFLAMLIRHELISLYRKDLARGGNANLSLDAILDSPETDRRSPLFGSPPGLSIPASQPDDLDVKWAKAKHEAAIEHVLTKVAMKQQSRDIYMAYVIEERPINEISAQFGVSPDIIYKVKHRVERMIEAVEEEYAEEK